MVKVLQARAIFDCNGDEESELSFLEGDVLVEVRETPEEGWLYGKLERTGEEGLFPDNYVELVHVEISPPKPLAPPQLPARSAAVNGRSIQERAQEQTRNTAPVVSDKPTLPTRQPTSGPSGMANQASGRGVALPGIGSRSMYATSTKGKGNVEDTKTTPLPPALPKRSNTLQSDNQSSDSNSALSVRERMANLSMANQAKNTPSPDQETKDSPLSLPLRHTAMNIVQGSPSPSPAARPALPPRTLTASPVGFPSSTISTPKSFQVASADVPVPKLTTFSRPRSARTSKPSSPAERKDMVTMPPGNDSSTPPKLPSRSPSASSITLSAAVSPLPGILPKTGGSIATSSTRFSPAATITGLPTISRNSQPLALPSRSPFPVSGLQSVKPIGGLARSAPTGTKPAGSVEHATTSSLDTSNAGSGSPFGVKLNSIGNKTLMEPQPTSNPPPASAMAQKIEVAPPLPARSNTGTPAPSEGYSTPIMKSQTQPPVRSFSPSPLNAARQTALDKSPTKTSSPFQRSFTKPTPAFDMAAGHTTDWGSTHKGTGAGMMMPPRDPDQCASEVVGIKADARKRYETLFNDVCTNEYIEGAKVHSIYVRSRLDSKTLAQIWDLVDVDNAGRLSRAQFCMGLYLIDERLGSGTIPLEVSDELWIYLMQ